MVKKVEKGKEPKEAKGHKEKPVEKAGKPSNVDQKAGKPAKLAMGYEWIEFKPEELVEIVVSLANSGHTESDIGMMLRDQYGIPKIKKVIGKTIGDIFKEKGLQPEVPRDLLNLIRKSVILQKHREKHKKDMTAKHGYLLTISKIRRLVEYYHKKKFLPAGWRYTPEQAALLVK